MTITSSISDTAVWGRMRSLPLEIRGGKVLGCRCIPHRVEGTSVNVYTINLYCFFFCGVRHDPTCEGDLHRHVHPRCSFTPGSGTLKKYTEVITCAWTYLGETRRRDVRA